MARASGTFQITSMGEDTYQELDGGGKLTRANGDQRFTGDIEGEGSVEWLMCYSAEGGARYVGLQRVSGTIGVKLYKGRAQVVTRSSPNAVYDASLASFAASGGQFSQAAAPGFIELFSLQSRTAWQLHNRSGS